MSELLKYPVQFSRTNIPYIRLDEDLVPLLTHRQVKEAYVQLIDSRPLSDQQRRMCYALINAICDYTGESLERGKECLKLEFMAQRIEDLGDKVFSLSNAPMSLIAAFQKYLIRFIVENDIPTKFSLLEYADDTRDYVYACLIHKKCCICGRHADLHHIDAVGMGRDRSEIIHEGLEAISLCREHHTEAHTIGKTAFFEKWHLTGGITLDKTLCRIYGVKGK